VFITAGEILNRVASEVGLDEVSDPYASQDPTFVRLRRLLQSAAGDLLDATPTWPHLIVEHTFNTAEGQTNYPVPDDFRGMIYQTGWNRTIRRPLGGPASPAQWQRTIASSVGSTSFNLIFRLTPLAVLIRPPPPEGLEISYEYASNNWVQPAGEASATARVPTVSGDIVWFDEPLVIRALKLKQLQATGFDTTVAAREYQDALSAAIARAGSAPKLTTSRRVLPQGSHTVSGEAAGGADPFGSGVLY
jgi:hypothetical protein